MSGMDPFAGYHSPPSNLDASTLTDAEKAEVSRFVDAQNAQLAINKCMSSFLQLHPFLTLSLLFDCPKLNFLHLSPFRSHNPPSTYPVRLSAPLR